MHFLKAWVISGVVNPGLLAVIPPAELGVLHILSPKYINLPIFLISIGSFSLWLVYSMQEVDAVVSKIAKEVVKDVEHDLADDKDVDVDKAYDLDKNDQTWMVWYLAI